MYLKQGEENLPAGPKPALPANPARPIRRARKWLFRLTAGTLIPTLFFGALELGLRLAGYGHPTDYFLDGSKLERDGVWIDNADFSRWVFPRHLDALPKPVPFALPKAKAGGTFRIFVFGESAAMGFPDPSTSFPRILGLMLRAQFPDTRFEVVNTALAEINSHIALQIARQCPRRQPDLFVLYVGNNEVVGPFGAASTAVPFSPSRGFIRTNLAVRTTRTGQLADRIVKGMSSGGQVKDADGMAMFADSHVRADDPRLAVIFTNFRDNLGDILRLAADRDIPVVLCTVPVNLKHSAPFGSRHPPDLSSGRTADWNVLYKAGVELEEQKKFAEAMRSYTEAARIDDRFADLAFRLGRCFEALADKVKAREQYQRACDLDTLRFRSTSATNTAIREIAAAHAVRLADIDQAFAEHSGDGTPGEEFFLEHVHMNFHGNYLAARVLFETITHPATPGLPSASAAAPLSEEDCARRLAYTPWSEWRFGTKIHDAFQNWPPCTVQLDRKERDQRWKERLAALRASLQASGYEAAVAEHERALAAAKEDWMMSVNFGDLLAERGRLPEAARQYEAALQQMRHSYAIHYKLATVQLKRGNGAPAETCFRTALRLDPDNPEAAVGLAEALQNQGRAAEAEAIYDELVRAHPELAATLQQLRQVFNASRQKAVESKERERD